MGESSQLASAFAQVKSEAAAVDPSQARLLQNINQLLDTADAPIGNLRALCAESRSNFDLCCQFFHEDPKKTTAEVVFKTFASLSTAFAEIKSQRERAAASAARRERLQQKKDAVRSIP